MAITKSKKYSKKRISSKKKYFRKPGTAKYQLKVRPYTRQLFPKRVSTKMVWSEVTDVVTGVNTPYFILYSLSGMNDPNKTGGLTHKPMGFAQMNSLYVNYLS